MGDGLAGILAIHTRQHCDPCGCMKTVRHGASYARHGASYARRHPTALRPLRMYEDSQTESCKSARLPAGGPARAISKPCMSFRNLELWFEILACRNLAFRKLAFPVETWNCGSKCLHVATLHFEILFAQSPFWLS